MKALKRTFGLFLIFIGILYFIFLQMLNDPEVEGESGRVSAGSYFIAIVPIIIGLVILFLIQKNKISN